MCLPVYPALLPSLSFVTVQSQCSKGCNALASYCVWQGPIFTFIAQTLHSTLIEPSDVDFNVILSYNNNITNKDSLPADVRINVPFPYDCINGEFLGHVFWWHLRWDCPRSVWEVLITMIPMGFLTLGLLMWQWIADFDLIIGKCRIFMELRRRICFPDKVSLIAYFVVA